MSVNPPPPGSGRDHEWDASDQQGNSPNTSGQQPNTGWNQQSEPGWDQQPETGWVQTNQQPDTGWGQPNRQPNNGWTGAPVAGPTPPNPGGQAPGRQYPQPKRPQSDSAQAQAGQTQYPQSQNQQAQYAQGPYVAAPAAQPRSRKGLIAMGAVLIVLVGLGVGWGAATLFGSNTDGDTVAAPASSEAKSPGNEASSSQEPSETPTTSESPALPDDPAKALQQLVDTDRSNVKADLDGKWVPQLSSKKLGLKADGKTWKEKDILAEHQQLREEFPRVQLVWSGDFKSFKEDNFWVTVVGIGYDDPDQALSWCSSNGLGADFCYAKQLNTSGGIEGTTKLQD